MKKVKQNSKKLHVLPKNAKTRDVKMLNHSAATRNYAKTDYQTVEEVPWHLVLIKLEKWQNFQKTWKKLWKLV